LPKGKDYGIPFRFDWVTACDSVILRQKHHPVSLFTARGNSPINNKGDPPETGLGSGVPPDIGYRFTDWITEKIATLETGKS
jgi:hypothetical protein